MKNYQKFNFTFVVIVFLMTLISTWLLPSSVPVHSTFQQVDLWGSKYTNFIMPVLMLIIWFFTPYLLSQKNIIGRQLTVCIIGLSFAFFAFTELDSYWIYQDFQYTGFHVTFNSWLLFAIALIYLSVSFMIFFMRKDELLFLHWKEFKPQDSDIKIQRTKLLFTLSGFLVSLLLMMDSYHPIISISFIVLISILLAIKFLYGGLSKHYSHLPQL